MFFGARKLLEDDPISGKYINSPETLIYNKSKLLYGIFQSKENIRDKDFVLLVEGYADLISVFQSGIQNVVASSGTALTQEQIQLVARYTKNITIVYDADSAGAKAALRGVDLILENDLDVRVARLPEGEDPDSFVKKLGANAFTKLIDEAVSFVDFIAQSYEREGKFESPEGQAQVVRAIVQTIAKMRDELKRNFYIKQVANKYSLYESILYAELEKHIKGGQGRRELSPPRQSFSQPESEKLPHETPTNIPISERDLIQAMLDGGQDTIRLVFNTISVEDFVHPVTKILAGLLLHRLEEGLSIRPSELINDIDDESVRQLIFQLTFSPYPKAYEGILGRIESVDPSTLVVQYLQNFQLSILKRERERIQQTIREAKRNGEDATPFVESDEKIRIAIRNFELQAKSKTSK